MADQIEKGFPDFKAGLVASITGDVDTLLNPQVGGLKNSTTLWDIKTGSANKVSYKFNGATVYAYQDPRTGLYWAKDITGHGDSAYKVFEKRGNELHWVTDADKYGNDILNKHKSITGTRIKLK